MSHPSNQQVKLVSTEFYHFKGFVVSRIKHLKVTFTEILQILNATNGSGKTTFINELPPFSINKDMFEVDGFKRHVYNINGKLYEIYSDHKTNSIIDLATGENLNPGGTITTHNTIIESLFGVSPYQWAIAMGGQQFTSQDKNGRRKWIEAISGVDFNYAFGVYDKLVKNISGTKQAVKIIGGDLIAAEERQVSEGEITTANLEHAEITQLLTQLLAVTPRVAADYNSLITELDIIKNNSLAVYTKLMRKRASLADLRSYTWHSIDDTLNDYRDQINRLVGGENSIIKVMDKESRLVSRVSNNELSPELIESRLEAIDDNLTLLRTELSSTRVSWLASPKDLAGAKELQKELTSVPEVAEYMVSNSLTGVVRSIGRSEYNQHSSNLSVLTKELDMNKRWIKEYEGHLKELANGDNVSCPKCTHLFKVGGNEEASITVKLDECLAAVADIQKQMVQIAPIVEAYEWYDNCRNAAMAIFKNRLPTLSRDISDQLQAERTLESIILDLSTYSTHVDIVVKGLEYKEEKAQYLAAKATYSELEELLGYKSIDEFLERNQTDLANIRGEKRIIEQRMNELTKAKELAVEVSGLYEQYFKLQNKLNGVYAKLVSAINHEVGNNYSSRLQSALGARSRVINEHESNTRLINSLSDMIKKHELKLKAYLDIHKALNPTTGIIAEQVTGYCTQFSEQVTKVIDSVWGYSMVILPPKVERKGLDYQFPVQFENGLSSDVAKTSTSQTGVINLAISLCTRAALGLGHLPLFLDEVSKGLDTHHAVTIREFVKGVIKGGECSSVFFVDHEVNTRHQLGDYEEIVFNASQVITSEGYNNHVEIAYY